MLLLPGDVVSLKEGIDKRPVLKRITGNNNGTVCWMNSGDRAIVISSSTLHVNVLINNMTGWMVTGWLEVIHR